MKFYLIAFLLCAVSGHRHKDPGNMTFVRYFFNAALGLPDSDLQLRRCFSDQLKQTIDDCSASAPVKMVDSTLTPMPIIAKCVAESLDVWDNVTNSPNATLLRAALIDNSNLTDEQKAVASKSIEECVASDGLRKFPHRFDRPHPKSAEEKCPVMKTLNCAAGAWIASGCARTRMQLKAEQADSGMLSPMGMKNDGSSEETDNGGGNRKMNRSYERNRRRQESRKHDRDEQDDSCNRMKNDRSSREKNNGRGNRQKNGSGNRRREESPNNDQDDGFYRPRGNPKFSIGSAPKNVTAASNPASK